MSANSASIDRPLGKRSNEPSSHDSRGKTESLPKAKRGRPASEAYFEAGITVLSDKVELSTRSLYKPRSPITSGIYKEILSVIQSVLVSEPSETLCEAAHEIISVFKEDDADQTRRKKLGEILPPLLTDDEMYSTLLRLCALISDFRKEDDTKQEVKESAGIALDFDEDDEDEGNQEVYEAALENEGLAPEEEGPGDIEAVEEPETVDYKTVPVSMNPNEVAWSQFEDGLWLRRELEHLGYPAEQVEALEKATLDILDFSKLSGNSLIENKLVQLLKFKNLSLCKMIVHNKFKLWLANALIKEPSALESLLGNLLESTDPRAAELYKEVTASKQKDDRTRGEEEYPQPSCLLDLGSLVFEQGGRLMSNPTFKPQTETFQVSKKNYDEVHVQAAEKVQVNTSDLISIKSGLPSWMHAAFAGFERLNPIQSKVFPIAFNEYRENILMCAPTGAGKTNVAMLTIMNVLSQHWMESKQALDLSNFKIVYIAPMKALVQEVVKSFSVRLNPLGVNVRELSGDVNISRDLMADTQVIVTTPEKWDVITRKAAEAKSFTQLVRLVIIDEVHLLHDSRGPVLEALVARTLRQSEFVRIVALSATLPNYDDVALFLRVKKGLFYFGSEYRPVPLEQTYVGITSQKGLKRAQVTNEVVFEKVMEDVGGKQHQVLVFVHGRKETVRTARELRSLAIEKNELAQFVPADSGSKGVLEHEAAARTSSDLKDLLPFGIGIHHAGLSPSDRSTVEDLFAARHLSVIVCTLTLAWGVNLPAHTVIIKGTQIYMPEKGDWVELSPMDMMQMMGRAGRPQYDSSGHGIVITNKSDLQYYLSLNNMQLPIESQLVSSLADLVNAELVLGSINSREDAARWLAFTYLYVRMLKNPHLYGVPLKDKLKNDDPTLRQRRVDLAHAALHHLDKHGLCKYDRRSGAAQVTALGRVSSFFYLKAESVAVYNQHLKPTLSDMDLLRLFSLSREFKFIPVREEEKVELMKLVELVPVPIKGGAEDACSKINVLLQAYVSRLSLEGFALMADLVFVTQNAGRLFRALFEIALKRGWSVLARRCLVWCKVVELRMWPIQSVLRHFPESISDEICRKIERKGISNEDFALLHAEDIGQIVKNPKLGKSIFSFIQKLPKINATAYVQPITRSTLLIKIDLVPEYLFDPAVHHESEIFHLFVEDVSQQHCLYSDQFSFRSAQVLAQTVQTLTFTVAVTEPVPPFYFVRIVSDRWLVQDTLRPISFRNLVLPEKNLPLTELRDMHAVPVSALNWKMGQEILSKAGIDDSFNALQSQLWESLWGSDSNAIVCAPLGSGKSVLMHLAILRVLRQKPDKKCVYLTSQDGLAAKKLKQLQAVFEGVEMLTGEPGQDVKIMEASKIIVSTPLAFDLISRKWRTKRTRRLFESTALFISDNLHLLDSEEGAVQELVTSRMRYIAAAIEKENKIRIIGCASAVSNAHDLASWIGASQNNVFSFGSEVRSVPLEIVIHGFDMHNSTARQSAAIRPLYGHMKKGGDSVIAFCTSRKQTRSAAADLALLMAENEGKQMVSSNVTDKALAVSLEHGIGFLHPGMTEQDRATVTSLFRNGTIRVIFVSQELMWSLELKASLVAVMDTTSVKQREASAADDYRAVEVQQMLSLAGRRGADELAKCVLFCANSKREFYKRFIHEPLNVESLLDESLGDHLNAEIANGTVKSRQDCIDWLTWTLFYRRITKNPNYYSLAGTGHQMVSDFLSGLVEDHVDHLIETGMIMSSHDEDALSAGDLGLVASYYNVKTSTIEMFKRSVSESSRRRNLIEVLSQAQELSCVDDGSEFLKKIALSLKLTCASPAFVLLHAHFNRVVLPADLQAQLEQMLPTAHRLVLALVDVISTSGWLKVALAAMEIAPMLVQGCLPSASALLQLPHFDNERCEEARASFEIEDVVDILAMDESDRAQMLSGLTESQIVDVARACNMFPSITIGCEKNGEGETVSVTLEREGDLVLDKRGSFVPVYAPRFPKQKEEGWWLLLGNEHDEIEDLKRVTISQAKETVTMRCHGGEKNKLKLLLMSDSFIGCDQEETVYF